MSDSKKRPPLKDEVSDIVKHAGGWLNVIKRVAPILAPAVSKHGFGVDCPFPERHREGGGRDSFRFSEKTKHEGRAICSCNQDGWGPFDLLEQVGVGSNFVEVCHEIKRAYGGGSSAFKAKEAPAPQRQRPRSTADENKWKAAALKQIVKDLLPLGHPDAAIGRMYFRRRGIPLNKAIGDVKFHPALPYYNTRVVNGERVKELVGNFPAIVSAFRNGQGRVMNLHRIFLTQDGKKLDHPQVKNPKKVCSGLDNWSKTPIAVATVPECRTLHICEGVEKGWALHLVTGESVRAANSCTSLPGLYVNRDDYDDVVLWADHDPYNEKRERHGDGQTYMFKLFVELMRAGFRVCLMIPDTNPTTEAKGPDWEDIVVANKVLEMPLAERFDYLRTHAQEGGVFTPTGHVKKHSHESYATEAMVA
ncbi:toprim domain-containing protein [Pseudomonas sp. P66]|uniref:Toprim domain-containing protein n=1 Tax=Pseudomonas arcuscaelestis TaxID=2710591 RepID=A0ABS2BZ85_9PSED|nr:toprim domain-containing protein [Pseudomonas arcuscaelestis]MBM5458940.1 toprim domain-containing protein [Pseudomonas arcuscaelestis]